MLCLDQAECVLLDVQLFQVPFQKENIIKKESVADMCGVFGVGVDPNYLLVDI